MAQKDEVLPVRLSAELKAAFLAICEVQEIPASQIVREFIRDYVKKHAQGELPLTKSAEKKVKK